MRWLAAMNEFRAFSIHNGSPTYPLSSRLGFSYVRSPPDSSKISTMIRNSFWKYIPWTNPSYFSH